VRDAVYSASSVEEARQLASRGLGVAVSELRYVVLDAGSDERPAQIAVLLDAMRSPRAPGAREEAAPRPPVGERARTASRSDRIRRWFEALSDALGPVDVEIEDSGPEGVRVSVLGEKPGLVDEEWSALEMLLRRAFGPPRVPGRITLEVPGRREGRENGLRERARELAEAVRGDGEPRSTEPLNSYERRLVHVSVAELGGLVTESQGEGALRCVSIRVAEAPAES
jgi:spoIIIJ-associated protein